MNLAYFFSARVAHQAGSLYPVNQDQLWEKDISEKPGQKFISFIGKEEVAIDKRCFQMINNK